MQLDVDVGFGPRLRPHVFQQATQVAGYVRPELDRIDVAGTKDAGRVGVLDKREQQVLEKHGTMRLGPCETAPRSRLSARFDDIGMALNCSATLCGIHNSLTAGCWILNGPPRGHARLTRQPS
jgi:hypothetical protein